MKREVDQLEDRPFDLLVIGGGIYGAWTAYDATLRGLKVALIEKNDWASGTSSISSKLIHGGLRYLEHFWISLVRKTLTERQNLMAWGPHRVKPLDFLIPLYRGGRLKKIELKLGLWLYDQLAGRKKISRSHQFYKAQDFANQFGFLKDHELLGGYAYTDSQVDDARFALEIVDGALQNGAVACNYLKAEKLIIKGNRVIGVEAHDQIANQTLKIKSSLTISAAGPWQQELLPENSSFPNVLLAKGSHLVMPSLGQKEAVLLTTLSDGRVFFLIPWYGQTLLGTTDTNYQGSPDEVKVTPEDTHYLLEGASRALRAPWTEADIISRFAGARTLKKSSSKNPSATPRKWSLYEAHPGLLAPLGGKLTSARLEASQTVDRAFKFLNKKFIPCATERPLPWCPSGHYNDWLQSITQEGKQLGLSENLCRHLADRYGTRITKIYQLISQNTSLKGPLVPALPFCQAEALHAIKEEMTENISDVFRRRLPLEILTKMSAKEFSVSYNKLKQLATQK